MTYEELVQAEQDYRSAQGLTDGHNFCAKWGRRLLDEVTKLKDSQLFERMVNAEVLADYPAGKTPESKAYIGKVRQEFEARFGMKCIT